MAPPDIRNGNTAIHLTSSDAEESQRQDSGDLLNGIGSASSLNSTTSSVFSANSQAGNQNGKLYASISTPLTHPESSPYKALSPNPIANMSSTHLNGSAFGFDVTDASLGASRPSTPAPSTPQNRPQARPPHGEAKGYRAVWDPELDSKLGKEDKRRMKPKIRPFGAEVRLDNFINMLSLLDKNNMKNTALYPFADGNTQGL